MRIPDSPNKVGSHPPVDRVTTRTGETSSQAKEAATQAKSLAAAESAVVQVSAKARELALGAGAGFDAAKVERLRKAFEGGSFRVDAKKIAAKLVGEDG